MYFFLTQQLLKIFNLTWVDFSFGCLQVPSFLGYQYIFQVLLFVFLITLRMLNLLIKNILNPNEGEID